MIPLMVFLAVVWVLKNATEDVLCAARGKPSPRRQFREQVWKAYQARQGNKPVGAPKPGPYWQRGPARRYAFDSWTDAWADAGKRRTDRAADRRQAYDLWRAEQLATAGHTAPVVVVPGPLPQPATAAAVGGNPARSTTTPYRPEHTGWATTPGGVGSPADPAGEDPPADNTGTGSDSPGGVATIATPTPEQLHAMFSAPSVANPADPHPGDPKPTGDATASPADSTTSTDAAPTGPANATKGEVTQMSNAPEVSGHASAKLYAEQMGAAAGAAVASLEQSIAAMQAGKVTGPAIGHMAAAKEAAGNMAAALSAAKNALARHDTIAEGYSAAPDAGDKGWMTNE